MLAVTLDELQQDHLTMSVARALALANEAARARGMKPANSLVKITEEKTSVGRLWHIHEWAAGLHRSPGRAI